MSAFGGKADIPSSEPNVRFAPKSGHRIDDIFKSEGGPALQTAQSNAERIQKEAL